MIESRDVRPSHRLSVSTEAMVEALVSRSREIVCVLDREYRFVAFSEPYALEFESVWSTRPAVGMSLDESVPDPANLRAAKQRWYRALEGDSFTLENEIVAPSGRWIAYEFDYSPITDDAGQIVGAVQTGRNVTDKRLREEAEKRAERSENLYQTLVESSRDVVFSLTMSGRLDYVSPAWARMAGGSARPPLGRSFLEFVHPKDRPTVRSHIENVVSEAEIGDAIEHMASLDGTTWRYFRTRLGVTRNEDGQPVQLVGTAIDLTERITSERATKASEARFRAFVDQSSVGVVHCDLAGKFIMVNQRFCELVGRREEELLGTTFRDITYPDDLPSNIDLWKHLVATGEPFQIEKRYVTSDATPVWVRVFVSAVRSPDGSPMYRQAVVVDLTEQKRAQEEAEKREERFKFLTEAVPLPLWVSDTKGDLTFVNEQWRRRYEQELVATDELRRALIHPEDRETVVEAWSAALSSGETFSIRCRLFVPGSGFRWHLCVAKPEYEDGEIREWIGANVDLHDQVEREKAALLTARVGRILSEDLDTRRIVQALTDASVEATGAAYGAFFHTEPGTEGKVSLYALCGADQADFAHLGLPRSARKLGRGYSGGIVRTPDVSHDINFRYPGAPDIPHGHLSVKSYLATPIVSRAGEEMGMLLLGHPEPDRFTLEHERLLGSLSYQAALALENARLYEEQELLNRELGQARDAALASSKAKSAFLANMSHEIRTPLNGILGTASILAEASLEGEVRRMVSTIASSGETLLHLINEILDLARIEAGKMEIDLAPVDVGKLLAEVAILYRGNALSKGVALEWTLPQTPCPQVMADAHRLRQVISNLIANAIKFTDKGIVCAELSWEPREAGVALRVAVRDSGIGIRGEDLERVFDNFHQADGSIRRRYGGSGLGLAISRQLTELMGGELRCSSQEGKGSEFTLAVVLDAAEESKPSVEEACQVEVSRLRVLLVEDNEINVMVASRILEICGCEVQVATDGLQAIAFFRESDFDLILMDLQMPVCDGLKATRAIRQLETREGHGRLPILALSANAMASDREASEEAGMDGFIPKPVTVAAIRSILDRVRRKEAV